MTHATSITVRVPLRIRRRSGRKTVVTSERADSEGAASTRANPALVKALARAFRYQKLLDEGRYASISEMAAAERIERGYLGSLLRLTLLSPDLVREILDAGAEYNFNVRQILRDLSTAWKTQHEMLRPNEFNGPGRLRKPPGAVAPDVIRCVLGETERGTDVGRAAWLLGCAGSAA